MSGVCLWSIWTCRSFLQFFIILATISCFLHSSEIPLPVAGKMYPRGNHWAVGHLMGKKSSNSFPALQHTDYGSDYLRDAQTAEPGQLQQYARLMQRKSPKQMITHTAHNQALLRSRLRRDDRDKYLREITELLLLALKLKKNDPI